MIIDFSKPKLIKITFIQKAIESDIPTEADKLREELDRLSDEDLQVLQWKLTWKGKARRKQLPPEQFLLHPEEKSTWGLRSGRGFGKTLTAAQWISQTGWDDQGSINHIIAPTYDDVRYICYEGPTGLYSVIPDELIDWKNCNKSLPSITLVNGSTFRGFAADTPDRLRGPQCGRIWAEEIASWKYPREAWSNMEFGLRLGKAPQIVWTSTPRPTAFMRERNSDKRAVIVTGTTYENKANLTPIFYENVAKYEGTQIGRQELMGEILDPEEAGLVKRSQWRLWPSTKPLPKFLFIVFSLDTAFTEKTFDKKEQKADPTAASVWGLFEFEGTKHAMLLDCWEDHLGFPQLVKRVKEERETTYGDDEEPLISPYVRGPQKPKHRGRPPDMLLIEDKGSGISLRQSLALENILTESYNPGQLDKLSRLHIVSPCFAHHRVWAVESSKTPGQPRNWADPLISQVCTYVGEGSVEHDDLLDTTTQALRLLMDKFFDPFTVVIDAEEMRKQRLLQRNKKKRSNPYAE